MRRPLAILSVVCALVLTLGAGILHGRLRLRWGPDKDLREAGQRMAELPPQFGPWTMVSSDELPAEALAMLHCTASVLRSYVNQDTGETVTVTVLQGPSGPISAHEPEICYSSRAYGVSEPRSIVELDVVGDRPSEFWALTLRSKDVDESLLRVYYGWTTDGVWQAPDVARWTYGGKPFLYKIQLASLPAELSAHDPCASFLRDFVPVLRRQVFQSPTD
ncbi:MAG: exosortase-associated EpsI family protein [Pirellulaceae bacterium]|nr:exosortase-associated EpsI family protein [Pirellulaceae bacterium]